MTNYLPYLAVCLHLSFSLTHRNLSRTQIIITAGIIFKMKRVENENVKIIADTSEVGLRKIDMYVRLHFFQILLLKMFITLKIWMTYDFSLYFV